MLLLLKYEKLYIFIIIHDSFILPLIKFFGSTTVSDHTQTACSLIIEDEFYWKNKWVTGSSMLQLRNPIHGNIVTAKGKFGSHGHTTIAGFTHPFFTPKAPTSSYSAGVYIKHKRLKVSWFVEEVKIGRSIRKKDKKNGK